MPSQPSQANQPSQSGQPSLANTTDFTDYIQALKDRLETAEENQKQRSNEQNNLQEELLQTEKKVEVLTLCRDHITDTNDLAKKIILVILNNQSLVRRAGFNAELTKRAIKNLVVNCESIAFKVLELKVCIEALIEAISKSGCQPDADSEIMTGILALNTAIGEAYTVACNCITISLEALQQAIVVEHYLGDQDCTKGFSGALFNLLKVIHIHYHPGSKIHFPREKCPKDFYENSKGALKRAEREFKKLEKELEVVKEQKCLIDTEVDSIKTSISAAETAGTC